MPETLAAQLRDSGLTIVITGGSGWLGQATLEALALCFGHATAQRVKIYGSRDRSIALRDGTVLSAQALSALADLPRAPCLFLHYACLTPYLAPDMPLDEFIQRNDALGAFVHDQARRLGAVGLFMPSSGAVYDGDAANRYGALKLREERRFLSCNAGMRIVIARVFNLSGPYINKIRHYVLSSVIADILQGRAITLKAPHEVWRSYCHIGDLIALALGLLLTKQPLVDQPFDAAGDAPVEIGALAERARSLLKRKDLAIERPPLHSALNSYLGDGATMQNLMRRLAVTPRDLDKQILDTADYLAWLHDDAGLPS